MDAIYNFVKNFIKTDYKNIPANAVEAAKKEVLDSLATAIGGSSKDGIKELVDMVKEWGGSEQSTIIAYGMKCPAPNAAQVNGTMIHALDYDDGHPTGLVHVGCVAVSTAFAVAERMGKVSGEKFIKAIVLGADFASRLGLASRPGSSLIKSGWHPTTLYGFLSAAAIASILMDLDEERIVNALGIAYHQCAGNTQSGMDGALTKRMGPGIAAKGGITAALMAERGITGAKNVLEGEKGMFNLYHEGDYDPKLLTADLGKRFEGAGIDYKRYPCCGFTHPFIDATLALIARHTIKPDEIREITAYCGESSYGLCLPPEERCSPRNIVISQFSVPWAIGTALVKGKASVEDFTEEAIKREDVLEVSRKVTGILDPVLNRHGVSPGRVTIVMKDGTEYTEEAGFTVDQGEISMTLDDCAAKFRECSSSSIKPLSSDNVEKVIGLIKNMEKLDDAAEAIRLLG
jgi:2-methylcitrate dehydratase PrpD